MAPSHYPRLIGRPPQRHWCFASRSAQPEPHLQGNKQQGRAVVILHYTTCGIFRNSPQGATLFFPFSFYPRQGPPRLVLFITFHKASRLCSAKGPEIQSRPNKSRPTTAGSNHGCHLQPCPVERFQEGHRRRTLAWPCLSGCLSVCLMPAGGARLLAAWHDLSNLSAARNSILPHHPCKGTADDPGTLSGAWVM